MRFLLIVCFAGMASSVSMRAADPMLPAVAAEFGVTLQQATLLASAFTFPYAGTMLLLGPVGDAFGKHRLMCLSLAVVAAGLAGAALAPDYTSLLIARAVSGAFSGGIVPVAMALIGDRTSLAERQPTISRFLIAVMIGQLAGSSLSGMLVDLVGWRLVFGVTAAIVGLAGVFAVVAGGGQSETRRHLSIGGAIAGYRAVFASPVALVVLGTAAGEGLVVGGLFPFMAPMLIARGLGGSFEAGIILGAFFIGGIFYSMTVRWLISSLGQRGMMAIGGTVLGATYIALAVPLPWLAMAALYAATGYGFLMLHNTLQTYATELAPTARGSALAAFAILLFGSQAFGTPLGGVVVDAAGFGGLYAGAGIVAILLGLNAARAIRPRPDPEG